MYKLIRTRHTGESKKLNAASRSFYFTFHYIDNILSLNNSKLSDFLDPIYPIELEKKIPQIELGLLHTLTYIWKLTMRTDENFTTKKMISIFPL
jgi:hypothetical protein